MIPDFAANGNLPAGIHEASWGELSRRFGNSAHRKKLLEGLAAALGSLAAAGCGTVYINGSFVTRKPRPNDYDLCWSIDGVHPERLDPALLDFSAQGRRAMKAKYLGISFRPKFRKAQAERRSLYFFQTDRRTGAPKGIVAVDLGGVK